MLRRRTNKGFRKLTKPAKIGIEKLKKNNKVFRKLTKPAKIGIEKLTKLTKCSGN